MGRPLLRWLPAIIIAATVTYTFSVYPTLPERMPTHWGVNGQPNGWSSREIGAWILPALMAFLWLVCLILPKIDPKKANYAVVYDLIVTAIVSFQAVIQYAMLSVARGHAVDINTVAYVGLGALFVILGAAMRKAGGFLLVASGVLTAV